MQWVAETGWIEMLAKDSNTISNTSICLQISDEKFVDLQESEQRDFIKDVVGLLASEDVAHDIEGYRNAPPGFRIWGEGLWSQAILKFCVNGLNGLIQM